MRKSGKKAIKRSEANHSKIAKAKRVRKDRRARKTSEVVPKH